MATFTVTARQGGSGSNGIGLFVAVVTGATGTVNTTTGGPYGATQVTPNLTVTPSATGSWVYGSILGLAGTVTVVSGTTIKQDGHSFGGLELVSVRTTGTTTSATPVTVGVTSTSNGISITLAEILNATGLAEDASTPAGVTALATNVTTASFTPPSGALLVAMVQSNGGAGVTTMVMTDTSGLSLTWVEQVKQNGTGNGYSGVWTAQIPGGGPPATTITTYSMRLS